jgi:hypothetical protein
MTMKKLFGTLALAAALAWTTAADAAVVTQSTSHSDFTFFNPCTGEDVQIIGEVTTLSTATVTGNTISGTLHTVFIATGTGLTSGLTYHESVVFNSAFETSLQSDQATSTRVAAISVVAPGGGNNLYNPIFFHTTFDANGNLTSSTVDVPGASCR